MKRKFLLGLGTTLAVAVPVVAVVSCDDTKSQNKIETHIEIKQGTVINKITQGTLTISEIDKVNHILLLESFRHGGDDDYSSSVGIGLTTVQGTKEMYETFGLD